MKIILSLAFIAVLNLTAFSQNASGTQKKLIQDQTYSYAYISVQGKFLSKKLKVDVDFGDSPEQIKASEDYSEILTNKKSYAAILNYMAENQYELVETRDSAGIIFIMKKRN